MVVSVDRFLMAVPLLLLHLPFLLLFSLIFCGKKKKEPEKRKEPEPESKQKISVEREYQLEETQLTTEEMETFNDQLVNKILAIHKDFDPEKLSVSKEARQDFFERPNNTKPRGRYEYSKRIIEDCTKTGNAASEHKCTHPNRNRTEDEKCKVCKAVCDFYAMIYELNYYFYPVQLSILDALDKIFYKHGGKLPVFLENPEWPMIKEKLDKDEELQKEVKKEKKEMPPDSAAREQLEADLKKMKQIINGADYWNSPDDVFRERIGKDFEETRRIYKTHVCSGNCYRACLPYMSYHWTGRIYNQVVKNEKRCPEGMKEQLERDFYVQQKKYPDRVPIVVENPRWIAAKKRLDEEKAEKEKKKAQQKAK